MVCVTSDRQSAILNFIEFITPWNLIIILFHSNIVTSWSVQNMMEIVAENTNSVCCVTAS